MPGGRPRSSQDPNAARFRGIGDVELAAVAPRFPNADRTWLPSTRTAYGRFRRSVTARALRDVDMPAVKTLFVYRDRLDRLLATLDDPEVDAAAAARQVRTWQAVISSVSAELGVGPRNRQSLGIQTEVAVGSRLDAFQHTGRAPYLDSHAKVS